MFTYSNTSLAELFRPETESWNSPSTTLPRKWAEIQCNMLWDINFSCHPGMAPRSARVSETRRFTLSPKPASQRTASNSLFVEVDPVVVHATSVTAASGMLPVFAWEKEEGQAGSVTQNRRHASDRATAQRTTNQDLPTRPWPWLTCPRSFLVLLFLVG